MKRTIILATAATAMLTGCVKTEVNPVAVPEQEISYQAVVGPKTKAFDDSNMTEFSKSNQFVSYAYRIPSTENWGSQTDNPETYIDGATIHYDTSTGTNGVWRPLGMDRYYWPEGYKLTFFAWSLNRNNISVDGATVGCDAKNGIKVDNYDASIGENKNADFMVAAIRTNETGNQNGFYKTEGVPTLFKHKLCQVRYAVRLNHEYSKRTFTLKKVQLGSIVQKGNYVQYTDYNTLNDKWTLNSDEPGYEYSSPTQGTNILKAKNDNSEDNYGYRPLKTDWTNETTEWDISNDQYYFIPQTFSADQILYIEYTITEEGNTDVKTVKKQKPLSEIFESGWAMNTIYTINITIGLNEILWDPVEEKWAEEGSSDWSIVESKNN